MQPILFVATLNVHNLFNIKANVTKLAGLFSKKNIWEEFYTSFQFYLRSYLILKVAQKLSCSIFFQSFYHFVMFLFVLITFEPILNGYFF